MPVFTLAKAARLFGLAALLTLIAPDGAFACSRAALPAAAMQTIPTRNPDQGLFNRAVLVEVNYHRCKAGLAPLKLATGLIKVAGNHATWMASNRKLSHRSTIRGQASVQERVLASGLPVRRGSENVGYLPRYQFNLARKIRIKSKSRCEFTTVSGRPIAPHSYASLASEIVRLWMLSSGHRKNVLDRNVNSVGAALGYNPKGNQCGQFFMAQNFAG